MLLALAFRKRYFTRAGAGGGALAVLMVALAPSFPETSYADLFTVGLLGFTVVELLYFGIVRLGPERVARSAGAAHADGPAGSQAARSLQPLRVKTGGWLGAGSGAELSEIGRLLSLTCAAFMLHPVVFGALSVTVGGDPWRQLVFLPVAAVAGALFWRRIEVVLAHLERGGLT
ncbi:MAG: hypothetical protein ACRDKZ_08810 [Actinomycetota bacterium]